MRGSHPRLFSTTVRLVRTALALLVAATAVHGLAACGSTGPSSPQASATPVATRIVGWLPKDAAAEPPWNGRFVQVDVRVAEPARMDPADWRVFVNGQEPDLDKEPSILPYSPTEATVAFVFKEPYGELGTYELRVVYAPEDGEKVLRSWQFVW